VRLTWKFDWAAKRASAITTHGTYLIVCEKPNRWSGQFLRLQGSRTTPSDPGSDSLSTVRYFRSMADAMHSCEIHCEGPPECDDQLPLNTPIPGR
jgi:hypothetical protein